MADPIASPPAAMFAAVVQAREAEAARISRVLHDEVGQVLSAVGLQLTVLRMDYQAQVPELAGRTAEVQELLERAITRVRELSYELHTAVVERAGLHFALDRLAGRFRDQFGGTLRLQVDPAAHPPRPVANSLYRIAERALDNAVRHSQASQVSLALKRHADAISLEVKDNGIGFRPPDEDVVVGAGLGLLLIRFDAAQAGLGLEVASVPGQGAAVRATYREVDVTEHVTGG